MTSRADTREPRSTGVMVWIAIVIAVFVDAAYLSLIASQGEPLPDALTVPFVAGYLALIAVLLWLSLREGPRWVKLRPPFRAAAAGGLLVFGVLELFSIGLPLVVAGALATGAAVRALAGPRMKQALLLEVSAAVVALVVLVGGLEVTQRVIICPAHGSAGGSGSGLVTGAYEWQCTEGHLDYYRTPK